MIVRALGFVLIAALVSGCTSAETREEQAVLAAVDVLRDSSSDDLTNRIKLADALAKLPATSPLARDARDTCSEAYRLMAEGKAGTLKVKTDLTQPGTSAKSALEELAAAEEKLKKSEISLLACQKAAVELTMKRRKK